MCLKTLMKKGFLGFMIVIFFLFSTIVSAKLIYLDSPQIIDVSKGDVFSINLYGADYTLTIINVYKYTIEFEISGKLGTYQLQEEEFIEINLDDFDKNDLFVKVESIVPRNKAKIDIKVINYKKPIIESLPPGSINRTSKEIVEEIELIEEETKSAIKESPVILHPDIAGEELKDNSEIGYIIFIVLGIILIFLMIVYMKLSEYIVAGVPVKLINYVKKASKQNMSEKEIKEELKSSGWSEEDVDAALKRL